MNKLIIDRIVKWNSIRYERIYNAKLFNSMLKEELTEYITANFLADKLDGLSDLYFISIGALWKLNINPNEYLIYNQHIKKSKLDSQIFRLITIKELIKTHSNNLIMIKVLIKKLILLIIKELYYLGCNKKQIDSVFTIICDSNETKKLGKMKSNIKGDLKGKDFIPPTHELNLLAEVIENDK